MSQRSHIAISGSTAIWPCSVACRAPSRTSGGSAPLSRSRQHVPERLGDEALLGQLEGDDVDRLLLGDRDPLEGDHLLGHRDLAEVELDPGDLALLADPFDVDLGLLFRPRVPVAVEAGDDRPPLVDVEPLDLVGAAEVEVDRAGVDRGEGALGLDQAEHLPRVALDHRDRVGRGRAQRRSARRRTRCAAAAACPPARRSSPAASSRSARSRQPVAEDLVVGVGQRQLVGGGDQVPGGDLLVGVVEDRRLDRPLEELLRVAAEELVERVLAGDVDGEPAPAPPRPAPHLPQAGDGAGEGDADRRVELADVDPQLERVGRDHRQQLAARQPRLDLAPLLRRVAAAVGGDPLRQLRLAARARGFRGRSAGSARSRAGF